MANIYPVEAYCNSVSSSRFHNYIKAHPLIGRLAFAYDAHNLFMATLIANV